MNPTPVRRNNGSGKSFSLSEIAALIDGRVCGDPELRITGISGLKEAKEGDITFFYDKRYLPFLHRTQASAILTTSQVTLKEKSLVYVDSPSSAFTKLLSIFRSGNVSIAEEGVHPTAVIGQGVRIGSKASIGAHVVIQDETTIGERSVIGANSFIGTRCQIGEDTLVYPNVVIREDSLIGARVIIHSGTVIGSDGFGYEFVNGQHRKVPQMGNVVIEDDVELGANVCVDRGRFSKTWIRKGAKIDNLVQIAHNVIVGEHCVMMAQSGISGSTEVGRGVVIAGQSGLVGHITVGDGAIIGGRTGVTKSVPSAAVMLGSPAKPIMEQKRLFALTSRLPKLFKDVLELEKKFKSKLSDR